MKKIITLFALICITQTWSQTINDGLLLRYSFSGNAQDLSGNNFNGIVNASLGQDRFGYPNEAYDFNGTNEYIDFPNDPQLKPALPVSFSFYVKFNDLQPENTVIFTTDFDEMAHTGVWMNLTPPGYMTISYGSASGTNASDRRTKIGTTLIEVGIWYHVVGVVSGANDMDIYLNCINDGGAYSGSGGPLAYSNNPGSLGRKDPNTSFPPYYLSGSLDDFQYWSRVLTPGQIDSLCQDFYLNISEKSIDNENISVKVSPNPTSDKMSIHVTGDHKIEVIRVRNALGQLISEEPPTSILDASDLSEGVYFLEVVCESGEKTVKFIKN